MTESKTSLIIGLLGFGISGIVYGLATGFKELIIVGIFCIVAHVLIRVWMPETNNRIKTTKLKDGRT